jgi:predicted nucleotidyltransferase
MLLLKTKLRRQLLTYSFTHIDEDYYVRELASLINEDPGNLSRELRKLEEEGIFKSVTRGKTKYYSIDKKYPLFNEFKKIIFKTAGIEGSLKDLVAKYDSILLAFIYGSYANNKENKTSDIDLLLVGSFPRNELTGYIRDLEAKLNKEINFTSYTEAEFNTERKKEGGFLNLILKNKIIILKGKLNA